MDGGDGVAGGAVVPAQRPVEQPVPERCGVRVLAQDLGGFDGGDGVGDPAQHVVQAAPGQRGGVEVALDDLGGFGGVEPGGVVALSAGAGSVDGAGGEGLGALLGDHRVHAPGDGVPHQLGQAGGEPERVEHDAGATIGGAVPDGQEQVVGLGEGDQGGAGGGEQGGDEQVQGLAGALGADDAGGAVPRHPQVPAAGFVRLAEAPPDLAGIEPGHAGPPLPCRSGRTTGATLRSRPHAEEGVGFGAGGHPPHPCRAPLAHPGDDGPDDEHHRDDLDEHQARVEQPGRGCGARVEAGAGVAAEDARQGGEQFGLGGEVPAGAGEHVGQGAGGVRGEDEDEPDREGCGEGDLPGVRVGGGAS